MTKLESILHDEIHNQTEKAARYLINKGLDYVTIPVKLFGYYIIAYTFSNENKKAIEHIEKKYPDAYVWFDSEENIISENVRIFNNFKKAVQFSEH